MGYFQTWLLYHNALSSGVEIEDILKFARRTKERAGDESEVVIELKSQVAEQQKIINQILERDSKQAAIGTALLNGKLKNNNNIPLGHNSNINNTSVVSGSLQPLVASKSTKRTYGALDASNTATFNSNRSQDSVNNNSKEDPVSVNTVSIT